MPVLEPISKQVTINSNTYRFNLLGARKQGKISSKLIAKAGALLAVVGTPEGGLELLLSMLDSTVDDTTIDSMYELIFATEAQLSILNGSSFEKIVDVDLHFQGKYMEMMQLAYASFEANCQDFFTFVSGKMGKQSFSEIFKGIQGHQSSQETPIQSS